MLSSCRRNTVRASAVSASLSLLRGALKMMGYLYWW